MHVIIRANGYGSRDGHSLVVSCLIAWDESECITGITGYFILLFTEREGGCLRTQDGEHVLVGRIKDLAYTTEGNRLFALRKDALGCGGERLEEILWVHLVEFPVIILSVVAGFIPLCKLVFLLYHLQHSRTRHRTHSRAGAQASWPQHQRKPSNCDWLPSIQWALCSSEVTSTLHKVAKRALTLDIRSHKYHVIVEVVIEILDLRWWVRPLEDKVVSVATQALEEYWMSVNGRPIVQEDKGLNTLLLGDERAWCRA